MNPDVVTAYVVTRYVGAPYTAGTFVDLWTISNGTTYTPTLPGPDRQHQAQGWIPWWDLHPRELFAETLPPKRIGRTRSGYRRRLDQRPRPPPNTYRQ